MKDGENLRKPEIENRVKRPGLDIENLIKPKIENQGGAQGWPCLPLVARAGALLVVSYEPLGGLLTGFSSDVCLYSRT